MRGAAKVATKFKDNIQTVGKVALGVAAGGLAALTAGLTKVGNMAVGFDKAMMAVNSILQVSGEDFLDLKDKVLEFSTTTSKSAGDVAMSLRGIASMGFESADAMEILRTTVDAAGNMMTDTETTARAFTSTLRAFGMEAGEVTHVADVLELAANKSAIQFEELTGSVGMFLGPASAIGATLEDATAAMMTMTDAGYNVQQSATGLRGLLTGLIKPSDELKEVFSDLGYESAEAALKTEGLDGIMRILTEASGGSQEKMAELIPNLRGLRAVFALAAEGGENFEDSLNEVMGASEGMGEHAKMAEIRHQSWAYQITRLKSDLETFAITVGNKVMPPVIELIDWARDMLPTFEEFEDTPIFKAFEKISDALVRFIEMSRKGVHPMLALKYVLEDLGITGVVEKFTELKDKVMEVVTPIIQFIQNNVELKDVLIALGIAVASFVVPIIFSVGQVIASFMILVGIITALRQAWENNFLGIQEISAKVFVWLRDNVPPIIESVRQVIQTALTWIRNFWAQNGEQIMQTAFEIWLKIKTTIAAAVGLIKQIIITVIGAIMIFWEAHGERLMAFSRRTWERLVSIIKNTLDFLREIFLGFTDLFRGDFEGFWTHIKNAWNSLWNVIETIFTHAVDTLLTVGAILWSGIKSVWDKIALAVKIRVSKIRANIREWLENLVMYWTTKWAMFVFRVEQKWQEIKDGIVGKAQEIEDSIVELVNNAIGFFTEKDWLGIGRDIIQGIADGITNATQIIFDAVRGVASGLLNKIKKILGIGSPSKVFRDDIAGAMMEGWAQGIQEMSSMPVMATARVAGATTNVAKKEYNFNIRANYRDTQSPSSIARDARTAATMMGMD